MEVKVWLGGEGPSELGDDYRPEARRTGALEALLRRVASSGWRVEGSTQWKRIRKYTAGGARSDSHHADVHNVKGLVLQASEAACEVAAFSRDEDADPGRASAIAEGIAQARELFPTVQVIGGLARPALEGWILALLGERNTDEMSRARANERLASSKTQAKNAETYVAVIESASLDDLPPGCESLGSWLAQARKVLALAIHGE